VPRPAAPLPAASETPRPSAEVVPATDRRPAVRALRVLVGGFGGGCGRTTVAAGLGMALAARAHSRIAAVDACPDQYGMLTQRVGLRPRRVGLRELAGARPPVASLTELRRYLAADGPGGLEVLPGVHDLTAPGLAGDELAAALDLLARWFPVVIADGPSGWSQPVPATLLARSDLVVVTTRAGEAELAATDDALTALGGAGRRDLAASALVAVVETYPTRLTRAARQRLDDLAGRARLVVVVPFDPALTDSRPFAWRSLRKRTRAAFDDLATAVDPASVAGPGGRPPGTG
ncbi:MinD/ParA family protein, partial [Parafrankia sp. Ea1.12]|uniref:MinD/ParA family protein n=1 Tax=Parafrankia sp. Ea1.12 TaxID=573499 RepID=UPI0034CD4F92